MNYKYLFLGLCALFAANSCKPKVEKTTSELNLNNKFQRVLDSIYDENKDAIGIMVHIESPSRQISWSGAVGYSNKSKTPIEVDQPAIIASNTKTYVAAAMLRLIEEHKIRLDSPISQFISEKTDSLLIQNNYITNEILVQNLLSHTSGIFDYAGADAYMEMVIKEPKHEWTRDEQIELAMSIGKPLGKANDVFAYADTNYLILTEIIESITDKSFHLAIKDLLNFDALGLNSTWFVELESQPKGTKSNVTQYVSSLGLSTEGVDQSFDAFGGGGLAATTMDLALFSSNLFENNIFKNPETLNLIYTKANPKQAMEGDYFLGLSSIEFDGIKGYGHGGFWGTAVNYFPELETSISVFILDRDLRILRSDVNETLVKLLR